MPLKYMYITNNPKIGLIAEAAGVDRIFVDMEYIGKAERQRGRDTVQNHHTVEDVRRMRSALTKAQLLVRVNPIHEASDAYSDSKEEIDAVIEAGAEIVMLPYFKTVEEVRTFLSLVNGRARTLLLVETPEAVEHIREILELDGIDEVFLGLNDLSLGYHKRFMFQLLADGTVERICGIFREYGVPYGFGGVAALGKGMLPAEYVIREHYRLESTSTVLARSFCDLSKVTDLDAIREIFDTGLKDIRDFEALCSGYADFFHSSKAEMKILVSKIVEELEAKGVK